MASSSRARSLKSGRLGAEPLGQTTVARGKVVQDRGPHLPVRGLENSLHGRQAGHATPLHEHLFRESQLQRPFHLAEDFRLGFLQVDQPVDDVDLLAWRKTHQHVARLLRRQVGKHQGDRLGAFPARSRASFSPSASCRKQKGRLPDVSDPVDASTEEHRLGEQDNCRARLPSSSIPDGSFSGEIGLIRRNSSTTCRCSSGSIGSSSIVNWRIRCAWAGSIWSNRRSAADRSRLATRMAAFRMPLG